MIEIEIAGLVVRYSLHLRGYTIREELINCHFESNEKSKLLILKIPHYVRNDNSE